MKERAHKQPVVRRGFTLIELLVVISIIAILAAMLLPVLARVKVKAQIQRAQNEMIQIKDAISQYETAYSTFPSTKAAMTEAGKVPPGDDFTYGTGGLTNPTFTVSNLSGGSPSTYQTNNAELMAVLLDIETYPNGLATVNKGHVKNPQRTGFLNAKMVSDITSGGVGLDGVYRDPWGNPYIITLDLNSDDKCTDSFYGTSAVSQLTAGSQAGLFGLMNTKDAGGNGNHFDYNGKVMVWSAGPDKKINSAQKANQGDNKDNVLSWK